jgi:hypothetical protein
LTWSSDPAEQEATVSNVAYLSDHGYNVALLSPGRAAQLERALCVCQSRVVQVARPTLTVIKAPGGGPLR